MRVIVIEDKVYKVTESIFKKLEQKQSEINSMPYQNGNDVELSDYIDSLKDQFKLVGYVEFDFRL